MVETNKRIDYALVGPGLCMTAVSYGLCRYSYGLFIPAFRDAFSLSDETLAYIASISYGSYFLVTLLGIYISSFVDPRKSMLLGGVAATLGMLIISLASSPLMLALGVAIAGVVPGLAYTPISALVMNFVSEKKQKRVYSIINSGTSLGVVVSGPIVIFFIHEWRHAWLGFSALALLVTLWCAAKIPASSKTKNEPSMSIKTLFLNGFTTYEKRKVLLVAFCIGIATSVFWTFSVDLISTHSGDHFTISGHHFSAKLTAQLFWIIVGLAGFLGVFAGNVVNYLGVKRSMIIFQIGIASAITLLVSLNHPLAVAFSALTFGALFVFIAATLGIWSMEVFYDSPSVGFGLVFLSLSAGQFMGPLLTALFIGMVGLDTVFYVSAILAGSITLFFLEKNSVESTC